MFSVAPRAPIKISVLHHGTFNNWGGWRCWAVPLDGFLHSLHDKVAQCLGELVSGVPMVFAAFPPRVGVGLRRMSGPIAAALIAALGTVLVGLINYLVSRGQSRDARTRLEKDVEILGKLDKDALEFSVLAGHIQRSVLIVVYTELADAELFKMRMVSMSKIMFAGLGTAALLLLYFFVHARQVSDWHRHDRPQPVKFS
jgi:hypothetical protein